MICAMRSCPPSSSASGCGATSGWCAMRAISSAISAGASTKSTLPEATALRGMELCWALSFCAKVMPPSALIASSPSVPSDMAPESTTPMALCPQCFAREVKNKSMPRRRVSGCWGMSRRRHPSSVMSCPGGMTYTWSASTAGSPPASQTGICVARAKMSFRLLARSGARCCTMTKAMPVSTGRARRSSQVASSPPAEAPMPTMGNDMAPASPSDSSDDGSASQEACRGASMVSRCIATLGGRGRRTVLAIHSGAEGGCARGNVFRREGSLDNRKNGYLLAIRAANHLQTGIEKDEICPPSSPTPPASCTTPPSSARCSSS